jgi:hypothetical protein
VFEGTLGGERRGHRQLRVVNVYDAPLRSEGMRPTREVDWSPVVTPGTVLTGDFNAHGLRWNPVCDAPLHHQFLEELMDRHDVRYVGDIQAMHCQTGQQRHSVIDLVIATAEVAPHTRASRVHDPHHATSSDYA